MISVVVTVRLMWLIEAHALVFQYDWNENEMFLFRASLAYAMRNHLTEQKFE